MAKLPQTQGDLSQKGTGGFDGLPDADMTVEVVVDTQTGGMHGEAGGSVSAPNRASEDH